MRTLKPIAIVAACLVATGACTPSGDGTSASPRPPVTQTTEPAVASSSPAPRPERVAMLFTRGQVKGADVVRVRPNGNIRSVGVPDITDRVWSSLDGRTLAASRRLGTNHGAPTQIVFWRGPSRHDWEVTGLTHRGRLVTTGGWSPDNTTFFYITVPLEENAPDPVERVMAVNADGTGVRRIAELPSGVNSSNVRLIEAVTDTHLYTLTYGDGPGYGSRPTVVDIATGEERVLADFEAVPGTSLGFAPDGSALYRIEDQVRVLRQSTTDDRTNVIFSADEDRVVVNIVVASDGRVIIQDAEGEPVAHPELPSGTRTPLRTWIVRDDQDPRRWRPSLPRWGILYDVSPDPDIALFLVRHPDGYDQWQFEVAGRGSKATVSSMRPLAWIVGAD